MAKYWHDSIIKRLGKLWENFGKSWKNTSEAKKLDSCQYTKTPGAKDWHDSIIKRLGKLWENLGKSWKKTSEAKKLVLPLLATAKYPPPIGQVFFPRLFSKSIFQV
jgi:hypothetical protein